MRIKQVMMGLLAFCLAGCGERASTADNQPAPATSWSNRAPALRMATPGTLVVGETLDALGKDFIDPARGRVLLRFRGSYRTTTGASQQVSFSTEAQALNSGRLAWRLWRDRRVPAWIKGIPLLSLFYIVWPLDLLADPLLGLGQLDDLGVFLLGLTLFISLVPSDLVEMHRREMGDGPASQEEPGDPWETKPEQRPVRTTYRFLDNDGPPA